jgi:hypothetical protein
MIAFIHYYKGGGMTPIEEEIYKILNYVKFLVLAIIVYIFVLTVSELIFTIENIGDDAVGYHHKPVTQERRI